MKPDYTALDAAILKVIEDIIASGQAAQFWRIERRVIAHSRPLADEHIQRPGRAAKDPWRFVDGRLQALKRAGKIRFVGGAWALA